MGLNIKMFFNKSINFYIGLLFLVLLIFNKPKTNTRERFSNFGEYPKDTMYPLLYEDYELKKKNYGELSEKNYSDNYEYYPIYSSDSLKTNNIRYWKTPDNGKCSPANFCDVLYDESPQKKQYAYGSQMTNEKVLSPQPEWGVSRINYYESGIYE